MAERGLVWAMDAVAIELIRARIRQEPVPHHVGLFGQIDANRFAFRAGGVEEAQFHSRGVRGEDREVDADAIPCRAKWVGLPRPDSHAC